MTMRVGFIKAHDGHKKGTIDFLERADAVKLIDQGIALPATEFEQRQMLEDAKEKTKKTRTGNRKKAESATDKKKSGTENAKT